MPQDVGAPKKNGVMLIGEVLFPLLFGVLVIPAFMSSPWSLSTILAERVYLPANALICIRLLVAWANRRLTRRLALFYWGFFLLVLIAGFCFDAVRK